MVVYLDLKALISLYCQNCEPHHFDLNLDEQWQNYQDINLEEGVLDLLTLKHRIFRLFFFCIRCLYFHLQS